MGYELEHEHAQELQRRARRADCQRCRSVNCVRTDAAGDTHCVQCGRREYPVIYRPIYGPFPKDDD